jgi:hypothetical protein
MGPTQPLIQSVPGVKQPGHDADVSLPSSAEVKSEWGYTSAAPLWLNGVSWGNITLHYCIGTLFIHFIIHTVIRSVGLQHS